MLIRYGHFLFRYRNILFPLVLFTLLIIFKPYIFSGNNNADLWLDVTGILIIVVGQAIRAAVIGLAYIKRGGVNKKIYADILVTGGIFAHCRNPLYLGNLLILCGFLVIHNNFWVYILGGGFFLISYQAIVLAEESFLRDKFGMEFAEYSNTVNRWAFRIKGIGATLKAMEFNWRRVIYKDYTTALTWCITALFILTQEHIVEYGLEGSLKYIAGILFVAVIACILAFMVRIIKKNGRLSGKPLI